VDGAVGAVVGVVVDGGASVVVVPQRSAVKVCVNVPWRRPSDDDTVTCSGEGMILNVTGVVPSGGTVNVISGIGPVTTPWIVPPFHSEWMVMVAVSQVWA
jgi:hypothetical protein